MAAWQVRSTCRRRLKLRAAAYRGWRLPTLNELYRPFRAGADATAPNAALDPETMIGARGRPRYDAGTRLESLAHGFAARLDNAIANVTLAQRAGGISDRRLRRCRGCLSPASESRFNPLSRDRGRVLRDRLAPSTRGCPMPLPTPAFDSSGASAILDGLRPAQTPKHQMSATLAWAGPHDISTVGHRPRHIRAI